MNVVGRVGSLISQGVYSVATPFHPFGGAVDVIVVQQQDGSFQSTPWYVRFGKFQGVLKGAEKFVRISVNGSEANFHMHLDNSGEAYFIKEVESGKGSEASGNLKDSDSVEGLLEDGGTDGKSVVDISRLEHSVSDSGVDRLREECDSSGIAQLERVESDGARRYYDFENPQSSSDVSVELCEFGSNRYEGLDSPRIAESQVSDSEVILVSVDGHVLTAPVLPSEQNVEDVQLSTPQFHLGPGEGTEEFNSGDDIWAAEYICKLNASASDVVPHNVSNANNDKSALVHQLDVCEDDGAHVCQSQEAQDIPGLEVDLAGENDAEPTSGKKDSDGISGWLKREDIFKSCLALPELAEQVNKVVLEEMRSVPGVQNTREFSQSLPAVDHTQHGCLVEFPNTCSSPPHNSGSIGLDESPPSHVEVEVIEGTVTDAECIASDHNTASLVEDHMGCDSISVHSVSTTKEPEQRDEELCLSTASEELDSSLQGPEPDDNCSESGIVEPEGGISSEVIQTSSGTRFEISLCGKELQAGMGSAAAAEVFKAHRVSVQEFKASASSILKNENLIVKYGEKYIPWEKAAPAVLGMAAFGLDLLIDPQDSIAVESDSRPEPKSDNTGIASTSSSRSWRLWPIPFRRVKTLEHTESRSSSEELFVDSESGVQSLDTEPTSVLQSGIQSPAKQFLRTNVPTSEQIASLNLKDGQNMITFSFSTRVLGKQQVEAHIYLWKWNARIVISDVDGTITKSDVLGQVMPLVGKDWTQSGVANLFSAIKENGYQLLFLSARAIVQAYLTKSFLFNVKQDGKTLPYGPVVISPDGLFPSLYREVIRRAPHEFKIACLEDIRKLFPSDYNPFYAGFGNRDTDELSYRKIGIPKGKIFIINPKGEVAISHRIDVKSYTSLHTLVNDMFPPTSLLEQEDYNEWNFWRVPIPEVD